MNVDLGSGLVLFQRPRRPELGDYDWFDFEWAGAQVGKARCRIEPDRFTVFSIMVYPEYEGRGFARAVIEHFQRLHGVIIADRVRFHARDFWSKLGFSAEEPDRYVWRQDPERP
jgi:GNAT superfamily N-acetyltransferase